MSRKFNESRNVGSILQNIIQDNKLEQGIQGILVQESWKKVMGSGIQNYTSDIQLKKHTLYISLTSSVVRQELSYGKEKIIKMLNEDLNQEIIKELVFR